MRLKVGPSVSSPYPRLFQKPWPSVISVAWEKHSLLVISRILGARTGSKCVFLSYHSTILGNMWLYEFHTPSLPSYICFTANSLKCHRNINVVDWQKNISLHS